MSKIRCAWILKNHCAIWNEIERLVMLLILELRKEQNVPDLRLHP
jgi:hypothetical protein